MSSEPLLPVSQNTNQTGTKQIKVIFSDDTISTLVISHIPSDIDYKWLRRNIRSLRSQQCSDKSLKFLKNGVYINESQFKSSLSKYLNTNDPNNNPFFIHCMVGIESLSPSELINDDLRDDTLGGTNQNNDGSEPMGVIGFDRLRGLGFSDEEINLLRQQFHAAYMDDENSGGNNGNGNEDNSNPNIDMDRVRELEERWMENDVRDDGADEQFNSVPIGNFKHNIDLLIGVTIGFTLGMFSLILIRQDGLFNRRQLMAIYAGVMINIVVCFTRVW